MSSDLTSQRALCEAEECHEGQKRETKRTRSRISIAGVIGMAKECASWASRVEGRSTRQIGQTISILFDDFDIFCAKINCKLAQTYCENCSEFYCKN